MTTIDRFDPFARRIGEALDGIAPLRRPAYLDDLLRQTARTRQRPRWTFPERWLPVDTTLARPTLFGRIPMRQLLVLALLVALAAAALAFYVGSQNRVPLPFGLARNGQVAYVANGDIYVRDTLAGEGRLLVSRPLDQFGPTFSPDGTRISYIETASDGDHFYVANADGTKPVQVAIIPPTGNAQGSWAPDSLHFAMVYDVDGYPALTIGNVIDGSARKIDLGGLKPWDVAWQPPSGERLLIRAEDQDGYMDIYTVRPDGTELAAFKMPRQATSFGAQYTLSGITWSLDGRTIAYNSVEPESVQVGSLLTEITHFRLRLVGPGGSNDRGVPGPSSPYIQESWPTFSPDGNWILVHRWVFKSDASKVEGGVAQGWIAIMPADGSTPARDIGPKIDGGEDTGIVKAWSPDGTRILMEAANTSQVFSVDPVSGAFEVLPWTNVIPDWQRRAQ